MGEVASAFVSLVPSARGFGSKVQSQIGGDLGRAGSVGGKRLGGGMFASAKSFVGPMVGLFAAKVGVDYFKGAIAGASDLSESTSKVGVVFTKQFAPQIVAASKTAATSMGLSQNAYLAATGGLGNLLVSLKIAPKAAADMSQKMVGLAGDLASFNNVAPEEALAALQSGLTGETEPLKKFGINMNDSTLKAEALKQGLIKSTKEALTPQTKALAAQALIMAQTGTAQGDFARTSGGLANQQRILAAKMEDVKTKIGGFLLPIMTKLVTFLNTSVGPAFQKMTDFVQPAIDVISGLFSLLVGGDFTGGLGKALGVQEDSAIIGSLFDIRDTFVSAFATVKTTVKTISDALAVFFSFVGGNDTGVDGPFREMAVAGTVVRSAFFALVGFVQTQLLPAFLRIVASVRVFLTVALPIVQAFVAGMLARIGPLMPMVRQIFGTVAQIVLGVMGLIQAVIARVTSVILVVWQRWGTSIMNFIALIWGKVLVVIQFALGLIRAIIKTVTALIRGDWAGVWAGLKSIIVNAFGLIKSVISLAMTYIKGIIAAGWALIMLGVRKLWGAITGHIANSWVQIKGVISRGIAVLVAFMRSIPGKVLSAIGNVATLLTRKGSDIMHGLAGAIATGFTTLGVFLRGIPGKILGFFSGAGSWLADIGRNLISGLVSGVASMAGTLKRAILNLIPGPIKAIVANALGINSPSTVFAEMGRNTVEGFIVGVAGQRSALEKTMAGIVDLPSTGTLDFASDASRAAAVATQVRVFIGDRELTDIVRTEVDNGQTQQAQQMAYGRRA